MASLAETIPSYDELVKRFITRDNNKIDSNPMAFCCFATFTLRYLLHNIEFIDRLLLVRPISFQVNLRTREGIKTLLS